MLIHCLNPRSEVILDGTDPTLRLVLRNISIMDRGRLGRRLVLLCPPLGPTRSLVHYPPGGMDRAWNELRPLAEPYPFLSGTIATHFPDGPRPWTFLLPPLEFDDRVSLILPGRDSWRVVAMGRDGDDIRIGLDVPKSVRITWGSGVPGPSVPLAERLVGEP